MKTIKLGSVLLFLVVILLAFFLGGKHVNSKIEETIKSNYQSEIEVLKDKLNKQSELINSIINLNNKNEQNSNAQNQSTTSTTIKPSTAPTDEEIAEFEYIKENGGITITKYIGKNTSVLIPNKIDQLPVIKIGENAFADTKVKSVTLPSACKEIDWFAFYGCYALSTVYVPSSVKTIGYGAFDSCSKSLTIFCEQDSFAKKYAQSFGISYSFFE